MTLTDTKSILWDTDAPDVRERFVQVCNMGQLQNDPMQVANWIKGKKLWGRIRVDPEPAFGMIELGVFQHFNDLLIRMIVVSNQLEFREDPTAPITWVGLYAEKKQPEGA